MAVGEDSPSRVCSTKFVLAYKFEMVIWDLQAILSYPAIPNTLVLQTLEGESSPTAICLDQCKDAITEWQSKSRNSPPQHHHLVKPRQPFLRSSLL
ncbi:hypothetical protein M0R45_035379 [Rubus argutus]|uniref:Uncharacterized protein n=1 Tax=Rubus argutus TaxID=59490 RepID=A0AAW1VWN0_RUBAR